jgi:predicted DNA-binding protein YlxM (UPF0122 family)
MSRKFLDKPNRIRYTIICKENNFTGGADMDDMVMDDKLKEKYQLSILFDFYGELLKNHNKHIFEDYILNDLSLSEIAQEQGISRQGVYDIVKRCSKQLKECEEKLNLVKKFEETKVLVNRIKELSEQMKISGKLTGLEDIIVLSDNIMKDL